MEALSVDWEVCEDIIKIYRVAADGRDAGFLNVRAETCGLSEANRNVFEALDVPLCWLEKDCHVICVHGYS